MKIYILAFTICSAITGMCNNTSTLPNKYESWSECVGAGGLLIQDFSIEMRDKINKEKIYISYFCNENQIDESTTPGQSVKEKI